MASTFNFQQGRYDSSYADSLANLAKDYSTIGAQQGRVAQDAINQANDLAYRSARAQAQDTQSAIQNQLSYDNLGVNKEKIAIDQFNSKAKNQASYNSLVQSGRIKGPMEDGVDYGTMFDALVKNDVTKANIAQSNASINASNANAAQSRMQTSILQQQQNDAKALSQGLVGLYTPQTTEQVNPVYSNINSELDKVNQQINNYNSRPAIDPNSNSNTQWLNNMNGKISSLEELAKTRPLNSVEQSQYNSFVTARDNTVNGMQTNQVPVVPKSILDERAKLEANLVNVPKVVQVPVQQTTENATRQIINNKSLTPTAQAQLLQLVNSDTGDGLSGLNSSGSLNSTSKNSIADLVSNTTSDKRFAKSIKEDKEVNSITANYIIDKNPNLPHSELDMLTKLKTVPGLKEYVKLNYDEATGLYKNTPENRLTIASTTFRDLVGKNKEDTDNNSIANIDQFIGNNQNKKVLASMTPKELEDFMSGVSTDYSKQGFSAFKNLSDNSAIGDSIVNRIEIWNKAHPNKPMYKEHIGDFQPLGIFRGGDQSYGN